jgi:predicted NBD/HSP70 family sugar kinase
MPKNTAGRAILAAHGAAELPAVHVDSYSEELRDAEGLIGDRASNRAFSTLVEEWRKRLRKISDDPFGAADGVKKSKLDKLLVEGDAEAAGLVQTVIEEFAQELASAIKRYLRLKSWRGTERIVLGGGLLKSRVGELAIARATILLKTDGHKIDLTTIEHHPDEAGLVGCLHLAPAWILKGYDCMLAVDIGGSNIRAGLVEFGGKKEPDLAKCGVAARELWQHGDEKKASRDDAVRRLTDMLRGLIKGAERDKRKIAPLIGMGCPGTIREDGTIERGAQNMPGNWESKNFNLPHLVREKIANIGGHEPAVVMHNDAVVQGLSELPRMRDVEHWAVLTLGTGFGNARFTNKSTED